ncbi:MAG: transcription antitermination factor NusB [Clostridia bacterium]|nr:transcription antitermination factor NusB [Clostridia bacterium]
MRRDARDAVYKILYADLFNDNDEVFEKEMFGESKLSKEDLEFARSLLNVINEHKSEIEEIISSYAKGYKFERLYSTDKCALYIAVAELKYFADVPNVVAIDEALSLVRKYSTDESLNYVNGILASLKKDLEA